MPLSDIVMLAVPWSATTFLTECMLLSSPITERHYLPPSEQETDLSWLSWEYQNHLIWGKDNQNKILHDNQKIWSCNAALWKGRKKKEREREKTEQFVSLHHIREFRARELCIWVSWVLKENFHAVFSTHFRIWLLKMPKLKGQILIRNNPIIVICLFCCCCYNFKRKATKQLVYVYMMQYRVMQRHLS